ncbi:SANT/Myb-like DNA-binding domain-containing protein [Larkinella punicea]|nr:SANT/Myb-like DNA-binding domain-containing protein [Larkinella punicea]
MMMPYRSRKSRYLDSLWTEEEDRYLIRNLGKETYQEIGEALGRSAKSVRNRKDRLGLPSQFGMVRPDNGNYTPEEIHFLYDNHGKMTYKQMAKHLGRSTSSVSVKIFKLGFTHKKPPIVSTKIENNVLYFNDLLVN